MHEFCEPCMRNTGLTISIKHYAGRFRIQFALQPTGSLEYIEITHVNQLRLDKTWAQVH